MSRHEVQEVDRLDVETNVDGHGKKEGFHGDRDTEEDYEDRETEDANHNRESSPSERHEEPKERDRSPSEGDRYSFHAHNTGDAELEEAKEHVEKERVVQVPADQSSLANNNKEEDGRKTDVELTGGPNDERKEETRLERPKRDNWRQTKTQPEVKKSKEMNGGGAEGQSPHHSTPGRSLTPAAPKKVADKVHSIIEDYTTKMRNARPEAAADRTFVRVGSLRGSPSEPKGNISEMRARIERSASSVHTRPPPRRSVGQGGGGEGGARDAESIDQVEIAELEAKRKKKADDWLNKFAKPTDGGSHGPADRSGPLPSPGKSQTSTWKKRELELKKEREEREAEKKQLDEKRKKLDEERRNLRRLKEQDDATKREQHSNSMATTPTTPTTSTTTERQTLSHNKYNTQETEKTSRSVQSPGIRSSPLIKSLSISNEDEKEKKQKAIEGRLKPLNLDGLDKDELEKKAHELYERVRRLEEDKYDLEILLDKRESELNELKVKTGDAKGKFVKPQLKKVIKKDEGVTERDDVSFSAKVKAEYDDESKIRATTDEHLTRMTSTSDPDDQSDTTIGRRRDDATNHQHPQPPVEQPLQTTDSGC